jgi:hypothetical protein
MPETIKKQSWKTLPAEALKNAEAFCDAMNKPWRGWQGKWQVHSEFVAKWPYHGEDAAPNTFIVIRLPDGKNGATTPTFQLEVLK